MNISAQQDVRDRTIGLLLDWAARRDPPLTGETRDELVEMLTAAYLVADEAKLNLQRWINAARRSGLSWSDIGDVFGISKQAAQQRFRPMGECEELNAREGEDIVRLGANAFNELAILDREGRLGRELVRIGPLVLIFRASDRQWQHARRFGLSSARSEMEASGWTYVDSWMPFHYFKRPLALP